MTRFDAFEVYLKPPEKPLEQLSPREAQFLHWKLRGDAKTWEDCERLWQKHYRNVNADPSSSPGRDCG